MYVCMLYVCTSRYLGECMCMCMHARILICVHVCMCVCMYVCNYECVCKYMLVCILEHMHKCSCLFSRMLESAYNVCMYYARIIMHLYIHM